MKFITAVLKKLAITYSPTLHRSTIGASGLNFSVRDGKRWNPAEDVAVLAPAAYRRRILRRPCKEDSSWGRLRA